MSNRDAEKIINRNFSIGEVTALLALNMSDWQTALARRCFIEMGGVGAVFDRIIDRLEDERIIRQHPRRSGFKVLDLLCEGLRLRYEMAALQAEGGK